MSNKLSYAITSFAPQELTNKFLAAKQLFGLTIDQKLTRQNGVITKNTAHITIKNRFYLKDNVTERILVSALTVYLIQKYQLMLRK